MAGYPLVKYIIDNHVQKQKFCQKKKSTTTKYLLNFKGNKRKKKRLGFQQ